MSFTRYPPRPPPTELEEPIFPGDPRASGTWVSQATWTKFVGSIEASTLAKWLLYSNTYERFLGSAHDIDLVGDWTGDRGLGKGGFGMVGLWTKDDEHGLRHDEVVIKQQYRGHGRNDPEEVVDGLQLEAVIQRDLQRHELDIRSADTKFRGHTAGEATDTQLRSIIDRHVVRLRNYKINLDDPLARYYQIYCRYGTIGALMGRYKAFEQKFPEPFVWHVFHSLASAVYAMSKAPHVTSTWRRVSQPRHLDQWFVLHGDVKPLNVLLDYSSVRPDGLAALYEADTMPEDLTTTYPAVLLADFGISTYTSETQDPENTGQLRSGTTFWKPPEQELRNYYENGTVARRGLFGADFHPPANIYGHPTSSAHDIWPVAKIVFDMMYLYPKDHVSKFLGQTREALFREQGDHFLQENFGDSVPEALRYSPALVRLVRRCLTPNAQRRPSPEVLLRDTAAGLHRCISTMRRTRAHGQNLSDSYRVYYEGREIEELGLGTLNQYRANTTDYEDAQRGMPLDDPLRFPLPKWANFQTVASGLPIRRDGDNFIFTEDANPVSHKPPDQPGGSSLQVEPPESLGSHDEPRTRSGSSETRPHPEQKAATPTLDAYQNGMTRENMIIELKFRKHELGLVKSLQKSRAIKMRFAELLVDADKAGKPGRGVWQGRKKATRR